MEELLVIVMFSTFSETNPTYQAIFVICKCVQPGPVLANHCQEHSLSFSPRFRKCECNTTSDWLNHSIY